MKNAIRAAAAALAAALCIGATACGSADQTASQTETPAASSQTSDASSQTSAASSQTSTAPDTASATDAASTAASAATGYTQEELQATVDQLEAMPKAVLPGSTGKNGNGSDSDPSRDARLMQEYDALVEEMKPQNNPDDGEFALDGTWIMTSYDTSEYGEALADSKPEDLPHFFYGPLLKRIGAPEGAGTTFTDGQWAHAEWTGYRAIWKTDGNRYTLYIIMV